MKVVKDNLDSREGNEAGIGGESLKGRDGYDVIVVGTGYGGAVASCRLAQAGLKVCVLEKGRKWEPEEFPDSFLQVLRHIQFNLPFGTFGRDSLPYQLTIDGDCLALVGAGLGGGSLINAGVVVRTPQRTVRDPRWPKEWRKDWSTYESLAEAMTEPESVPHDFPNKRVMDIITHEDEDIEDTHFGTTSYSSDHKIKVAIRFKDGRNVAGVKQNGCIACGNCLHGCRYNAKNSTDKNYIAAAIKAGAEVRTESKAVFVIRSPARRATFCNGVCSTSSCKCGVSTYTSNSNREGFSFQEHNAAGACSRRWRVYLDSVNYISADFVVLAAGVLGTTEILLRSRDRGLKLSQRLGCGVSTNGNNVAYASGSRAPTTAVGLDSKELSNVPMSQRPGPSICNSYTSSAGYIFQGAAAPKNMPYAVSRAFTCKDAVSRDGLVYTVLDILWQQLKVWMHTGDSHTLFFNMVGYDESDGQIYLDKLSQRVRLVAPHDKTMVKKLLACRKLAARMRAELFSSNYRSSSVHLLGGCNAANDPKHGVTNPEGQVFDTGPANQVHPDEERLDGRDNWEEIETSEEESNITVGIKCLPRLHHGLYVCDGSLVPCAVGVNPSFTITTIAERVACAIVRDAILYTGRRMDLLQTHKKSLPANPSYGSHIGLMTGKDPDNPPYLQQESMREVLPRKGMQLERVPGCTCHYKSNGGTDPLHIHHRPAQQGGMILEAPVIVQETLRGQLSGVPCSLEVIMHMGMEEDDVCLECTENGKHMPIASCRRRFGDPHKIMRGLVGGRMIISKLDAEVLHVVDGTVDMCWVDPRSPFTQYMHYHLRLVSATGARYFLNGKKEMHPFFGGLWWWQESTTLHVTLHEITESSVSTLEQQQPNQQGGGKVSLVLKGELRVSLYGLINAAMKLSGFRKLEFVKLLAESIMRTYILSCPRVHKQRNQYFSLEGRAGGAKSTMNHYPSHVLHNISTDDGVQISVQQWPLAPLAVGKGPPKVVLLLNGYATECYWVPTEPTDLVRTLLQNGYEPWLLNSRLHPTHATRRQFNLDILAEYDIPAAVKKMEEVREEILRVHIVAHCVGGLLIHMAILGGHLPASKVASILCTNSSMFFRVTRLAMAKLILPLMPISMAILGNNSVFSLSRNEEEPFNHRILRFILRQIPRLECCTIDSCSVYSGIFGNHFWHTNVTPALQAQQLCTNPSVVPLSGLPHLRQVILKGHLIHSSGREVYMTHPERLATPTTYISGGKELLVTKETSTLAHRFMKMHHPEFVHTQMTIPEFGHTDLFVGEHSHTLVFPHILEHLRRVKDGQHVIPQGRQRKLMEWEDASGGRRLTWNFWSVILIIIFAASVFLIIT